MLCFGNARLHAIDVPGSIASGFHTYLKYSELEIPVDNPPGKWYSIGTIKEGDQNHGR